MGWIDGQAEGQYKKGKRNWKKGFFVDIQKRRKKIKERKRKEGRGKI